MTHFLIVIPVHNRIKTTLACLEHLHQQVFRNFRVYLVDDGSTDGTSTEAQAQYGHLLDLHILHGDGNLWWTGATHLGIENALLDAANDDWIIMMNDDVSCTPDFLARAADLIAKYPNYVWSPLVIDDSDHQTICKSGAIMKSWPLAVSFRPYEGRKLSDRANFAEITEVDFLRAQATFVPINVIRHIGNVNKRWLPHYHADSEFAYRAKMAGYHVVINRDLEVFHSVAMTGNFNTFTKHYTLRDFIKSLSDIRSVNAIQYKIRFAWLVCPRIYLIPFLITDMAKVVVRSLGGMLFARQMVRLRVRANEYFEQRHS